MTFIYCYYGEKWLGEGVCGVLNLNMCVCVSGLNAMQNLAALAAAATATQATASGSSAMTTSSSPLSALTSSGK